MKKIIVCVISLVLLCSVLCGCGNYRVDDNANIVTTPRVTAEVRPTNTPIIDENRTNNGTVNNGNVDNNTANNGVVAEGNGVMEENNGGVANTNPTNERGTTVSPSPKATVTP